MSTFRFLWLGASGGLILFVLLLQQEGAPFPTAVAWGSFALLASYLALYQQGRAELLLARVRAGNRDVSVTEHRSQDMSSMSGAMLAGTGAAIVAVEIETRVTKRTAELDHLPHPSALRCEEYVRELPETELRGDRDRARGELHTAKDHARESDRRSRAALDTLGAHIAIVEADGTISATNRAWRDFAERNGCSWTSVSEGSNYLAVCDAAAAGGYAEAAITAGGIRRILAGSIPVFESEYPCHSDDEQRWFHCRATRFLDGGSPRVAIAHENITASKLALLDSERRRDLFESLAEDSPVAMFQIGGSGRVQFFNRHIERLTGLSLDQVQGKGWIEAIHPEDMPTLREAWSKVFVHGESIKREIRMMHRSGGVRWAVVRTAPLHVESATGANAVGTVVDVTERKRMESGLLCVSSELSRYDGADLYRVAVARVAELLEVEIAFVAVPIEPQSTRMRTLAASVDGRPVQAFEYDLAGTPCEEAFRSEVRVLARDLRVLYPNDTLAEQLEAESYACIPLCDLHGRVIGVLAASSRRPFTDSEQYPALLQVFATRLAAEIEREKRERSFRELFEFAPDALLMSDRSGKLVLVNHTAEKLFQYDREEIVGKPIEWLLPEPLRADHEEPRESFFTVPNLRPNGTGQGSLTARKKDGSVFPVEISLSPLDTDTGVLVAAAVRDITERRRVEAVADRQRCEAELRAGIAEAFSTEATLEAAVVATAEAACKAHALDRFEVWTFDDEGLLARLGGFDTTGGNVPPPADAPPEVRYCAEQRWPCHWNFAEDGAESFAGSRHIVDLGFAAFAGYPLVVDDRTIGVVAVHCRRSLDGNLTEDLAIVASVVTSNIARRMAESRLQTLATELERRVEERTAALEAANTELDAFSASVSHDLRAPLRRIRGFASLLSDRIASGLPSEEAGWLDAIERSSSELSDMIRDLLTAARATRAEIREESIDLGAMATSIVHDLRVDVNEREVQFEVQRLPVVNGDPTLIHQVLVNILGNAFKYTRGREIASITMGTVGSDPDDREVVFVRDNGIGFDMNRASRLFGMFQRLHDQTEFEGTGIGLATVKRIVERHGGRVWAESHPGRGTTIFFTLAPASPR